jgi:transposase
MILAHTANPDGSNFRKGQWSIPTDCRSVLDLQQVKRTITDLHSSFRGYDADWIRAVATKKGAWINIPPRCNRKEPICFSPHLYRAGNLVERFFNKIKQCRRVATSYDKLAAN